MKVQWETTPHPEPNAPGSSSCLGKLILTLFLGMVLFILLGAALNSDSHRFMSAAGGCEVSEDFPRKVTQWCRLITVHAKANKLHPDLVAALIWQESGGNANAYSHSGAVGLMQVMPRDGLAAAFMCKSGPCFSDRPTIRQLKDPAYNVEYGTQMLAELVRKNNGDLRTALRQYGPMDVGYSYADKVLALYQKYGK